MHVIKNTFLQFQDKTLAEGIKSRSFDSKVQLKSLVW